jgi:hypothetical protein
MPEFGVREPGSRFYDFECGYDRKSGSWAAALRTLTGGI